jgi:hypothetical protein
VPAERDYVNRAVSNDDRIDNKRIFVSPSAVVDVGKTGRRCSRMLVSRRVQLALVALASVVAAAWLGGVPWGP